MIAGALLAGLLLGACGGGRHPVAVRLDGRARYPSDEGVATSLDRNRLTLDGTRSYRLSPSLRSFSTYTRQIEPVLGRRGQYVQVGLDGRSVVWLAGIAAVLATRPPSVRYAGSLVRVDRHARAVFVDGTVLRMAPGVAVPAPGFVQAEIDPVTHLVRALAPT